MGYRVCPDDDNWAQGKEKNRKFKKTIKDNISDTLAYFFFAAVFFVVALLVVFVVAAFLVVPVFDVLGFFAITFFGLVAVSFFFGAALDAFGAALGLSSFIFFAFSADASLYEAFT